MQDLDNIIYAQFHKPLSADVDEERGFPIKRPLLAHYTSMATFECIMRTDEFWMSNPLFMNDMEELRFGMEEAANAFRIHRGILDACGGSGPRYNALREVFEWHYQRFSSEDAFDTYCLCFCEHDPKDDDGLLSMWRGYGANGSGAAIVIDTSKLVPVDTSPLLLEKVHYAPRTERLQWIQDKLDLFASVLSRVDISQDKFYLPVHALLTRFQLFALFTKHDGFREEQEWRLVYVRDRDRDREGKRNDELAKMFHYHAIENRIEPKLKLKIGPIEGVTAGPLKLEDLIDRIILGPLSSKALSIASVRRMLTILNKGGLVEKIDGSTTPYRTAP